MHPWMPVTLLVLVETLVGHRNQRGGIDRSPHERRGADRDLDGTVWGEYGFDRAHKTNRNRSSLGKSKSRQDDREFVAAESCECLIESHGL